MQDKLFKTLKANYALWPVANLIAFRFVPGDLRILYCNAIGVSLAVPAEIVGACVEPCGEAFC